jgi:Ti-type conjugative transfer relaxase TraA
VAIYHFSAKIIGRSQGRSAVAAAAYRSASELLDERLDRTHDYTAKVGVVHSEILPPPGAPERWQDRATLWNEVEAGERQRNSQLARDIEIALPRELSRAEGIALARDFVREQFVSRGMVADLNVHWTAAADGEVQPHAHVMLTMREVVPGQDGDTERARFGSKAAAWNDRALLRGWRERWAEMANARLAELDHDVRIDHRSYAAQGIALEPQNKVGPAGVRREQRGEDSERAAEHRAIARRNGEALLAEPDAALRMLTQQHSTFTRQDMARLVNRHTDGAEQFAAVMAVVSASPELVQLGLDGRGQERFSTREMLGAEQRMEGAAEALAGQDAHRVLMVAGRQALAAAERSGLALGAEQRDAFGHVTSGRDLALVVGYAGTGKSAMLGVARTAWETAGFRVRGAALSGIAAEGLEAGSGIGSRTLASLEYGWKEGRDLLTAQDVLVIDEAGLVGSRQMERVLSAAASAGAKVVLVGDPEQLQAIEAGAAFRALAERHGAVEIRAVRRQREPWQCEATRELATGRTGEALGRYERAGMVQGAATREAACTALLDVWDAARRQSPQQSRVILAYRRADVAELNRLARERLRAAGELGPEQALQTERGERCFAAGDRLMFGRNERALGAGPDGRGGVAVKNGTLGTVEGIDAGGRLTVRLDGAGADGSARRVTFSVRDYAHVDHGYAATIHKAQGVTVDRAHVLASRWMDRHAAYVALTRHRDGVSLHYGRDEFRDGAALARTLGRERLKDTSLDYAGPDGAAREGEDLARRYAERRGLDPLRPESAIVVRPEPGPKRPRFGGLKLGTGRLPAVPEAAVVGPARPEPRPAPAEDALSQSVGRFAVAWEDALRMLRQGLPVLAHQQQALNAAQAKIEAEQPGFAQEVAAALQGDPELIGPAVAGAAGRAWLVEVAEARQYLRQVAAEDEAKRQAAAVQRAELDPVRARLVEQRMEAWWQSEKPEVSRWDRHLVVPAAEVERARAARSREVEALPDAELRRVEAGWQRQAEQEHAAARQRPSQGMRM